MTHCDYINHNLLVSGVGLNQSHARKMGWDHPVPVHITSYLFRDTKHWWTITQKLYDLLKVIFARTLFSYLVGVVKIHFLVLEDWASVHVLFLGAWCEVLLIQTIPFYTIKWILLKIIQMKWKLWIIKDNLKRRVVHLLTSQFDKWTVKVKGNMLTIQHKTER